MLVSGTIVQEEPYDVYNVGECRSFICSSQTPVAQCQNGDWAYSVRKCGMTCPQQPSCSRVNPEVCPTFSGQGPATATFAQAPTVQCNYTLSQFTTTEDIVKWDLVFGKNQQYNEVIMPSFCALQTTDSCPPNEAGRVPQTCSVLRSEGDGGRLCREWALSNPTLGDAAKEKYCSTYNTFECGCLNRSQDLEFRSFKQFVPEVPDTCWYRPCTSSRYNLIPSNLQNQICPNGFCDKINAGWENEQYRFLDFTDAQDATICPLQPKNNPNQGGGFNIWGLLLLLLIIFLILGLVYILIRQNTQEKKKTPQPLIDIPDSTVPPIISPIVVPKVVPKVVPRAAISPPRTIGL